MKMWLQIRRRAAGSPHQLIMVTIIAVINRPNYRPITEALLSEGADGSLLLRCPVLVHHSGLDPCAPWTPPLSSPPLMPSCLHFRDVEVTLSKGQGFRGHAVTQTGAKNRCHVIFNHGWAESYNGGMSYASASLTSFTHSIARTPKHPHVCFRIGSSMLTTQLYRCCWTQMPSSLFPTQKQTCKLVENSSLN